LYKISSYHSADNQSIYANADTSKINLTFVLE
jgi:hypothetical protein